MCGGGGGGGGGGGSCEVLIRLSVVRQLTVSIQRWCIKQRNIPLHIGRDICQILIFRLFTKFLILKNSTWPPWLLGWLLG